jgi:REP element-mobilizing transposase RayT
VRTYRRRLPHRDAPGDPVFVTWRLWGSLPKKRVFQPEHLTSGEAFVAWDRLLDTASNGPLYLRQPQVATLVQDHLDAAVADGLCALHAYAVMPNHVHLLWTPMISLPDLIHRVKGATAYQANKLLCRTGERFWQEEYFDRMVRTGREFDSIKRYIEWNPVKAELVTNPEDFQWSSAAGLKPHAG